MRAGREDLAEWNASLATISVDLARMHESVHYRVQVLHPMLSALSTCAAQRLYQQLRGCPLLALREETKSRSLL